MHGSQGMARRGDEAWRGRGEWWPLWRSVRRLAVCGAWFGAGAIVRRCGRVSEAAAAQLGGRDRITAQGSFFLWQARVPSHDMR